jgi:hypothetical protein
MPKKFGRPAPTGERDAPGVRPVRSITLPREGRALEGAYAEAAMVGAQLDEADEHYRRKSFAATLVWWTCICLFWIGVIWLVQNTR